MPQADRQQLTRLCKEGKKFPVYYLFGDESHYISLYKTSLVRFLLDQNITELNYSCYDADRLDEDDLDVEIESLPPFCPLRLVEVNRAEPETLCVADRTANKEEGEGGRKKLSERWRNRLADLPETTALLLVDNISLRDEKTLAKSSAHKQLCKAVENAGGLCVYLGKESPAALVELILRRAAKAEVTFPKNLATELVNGTNEGISHLLNETDKLIAWAGKGGTVTAEALSALTFARKEDPYYLFADAVAAGRTKHGLALLEQFLAYDTPPEQILSSLAKTFCGLYRARAALNAGANIERYCSDFSLPSPAKNGSAGYAQTKTFQNAKNHAIDRLRFAITVLESCEIKMKTTTLPKDILLQESILRIAFGEGEKG